MKNWYALVTGANGETYAMGGMSRKDAEHEADAWRKSIGQAAAVKRTRHTAQTLRRGSSAELAELLAEHAVTS